MTMKNTPADDAVRDRVQHATADEIRQFIERVEQLEAERRDIAQQVKEVYAEVKGRGFSPKAIRKLVAIRREDPQKRQEEQAILTLYMDNLGMT